MNQALLDLVDLSVTYPGGTAALAPMSLRFNAGEFCVLLGPSGAGKSTLLRTLNCLVRPTTGEVRLGDGTALVPGERMRAHRRATGMIFQHHQLIGRLTALRNTLTGRLPHHGTLRTLWPLPRRDEAIALTSLERVGLLEKATVRVQNLSGGEQQRVGVARAIAQQPSLVLADEPVASLDPQTARQVLSLIHDICVKDGITAILSLHQLELAREFADRIVGISHGRIVFDGPAASLGPEHIDAIYGRPRGPAASREAA